VNLKKRILILISVFCISYTVHSQKQQAYNLKNYDTTPLHFGMSLALNTMDFTIHNSPIFLTPSIDSIYAIENKRTVGFNINMVINFNFARFFAFRMLPGLDFGERDLVYWVLDKNMLSLHMMKLESTYLDFPFLIEYKSQRINNFRPYVIGGGSYKYDLAAQKKISPQDLPKIRLNKNSYYYEIGFGTDFFLTYFKFALELKYVAGFNNIMVADNSQYTAAIQKMTSKMVVLSFLFEGSDLKYFNFLNQKLATKGLKRAL
jgi:hypothetical protein